MIVFRARPSRRTAAAEAVDGNHCEKRGHCGSAWRMGQAVRRVPRYRHRGCGCDRAGADRGGAVCGAGAGQAGAAVSGRCSCRECAAAKRIGLRWRRRWSAFTRFHWCKTICRRWTTTISGVGGRRATWCSARRCNYWRATPAGVGVRVEDCESRLRQTARSWSSGAGDGMGRMIGGQAGDILGEQRRRRWNRCDRNTFKDGALITARAGWARSRTERRRNRSRHWGAMGGIWGRAFKSWTTCWI